MNNLEKMKAQLIAEIENMDCSEFEVLSDELVESEANINKDFLFSCNRCREKYGDCKTDHENDFSPEFCSERFEKYCME